VTVLLISLALAWYNVGTIWAHEVDIFRSWQHIGADFHRVQQTHWKKLPYWVFAPVALALAGSIALFWYHPAELPSWAMWGFFGCQALSLVLTALTWGRWQAALSADPLGARSPYLHRILQTHWLRTTLITAAALLLLAGTSAAVRTG